MTDTIKQAEHHQQKLTEKAAREQLRGIQINSWPHDAEGNPMAIVIGAGSDLVPTVQFGNVVIGPVTIMRPVSNESIERVTEEASAVQKAVEYVVGTERRLLQYALDPASRIQHPITGQEAAAPPQVAQQTSQPPQVEQNGSPQAVPPASPMPAKPGVSV